LGPATVSIELEVHNSIFTETKDRTKVRSFLFPNSTIAADGSVTCQAWPAGHQLSIVSTFADPILTLTKSAWALYQDKRYQFER
jgi:hypothetical protein